MIKEFEYSGEAWALTLMTAVSSRGCLNRVFPNRGVFHYAGTAFANPDQENVGQVSNCHGLN